MWFLRVGCCTCCLRPLQSRMSSALCVSLFCGLS
jgi:hypothetical protein